MARGGAVLTIWRSGGRVAVHPTRPPVRTALECSRTMQEKSNAELPADIAELVLVELPNGQAAWLKPERDAAEVRYVLTSRGRAVIHTAAEASNVPRPPTDE